MLESRSDSTTCNPSRSVGSAKLRGDAERASRVARSVTIPAAPRNLSSRAKDLFDAAAMQKPPLDPDVADAAPTASVLSGYDEQHLVALS